MKTYTMSNQKGGVAKTTTAGALASGLTEKGYRVLAVDLDPQCNFCLGSGIDMLGVEKTLYDVFRHTCRARDVIVHTNLGYDMMPGGLSLAGADMDFTQPGREFMLSEALKEVAESYDYAVIDTPPTLGILTINALTASNAVIVPMSADIYAIQGLSQLNGLMTNIRRYCNPSLEIAGLLLTRFNDRQNVSRSLKDAIDATAVQLGTKVFKTAIRESVAVRETQLLQGNLFKEAPRANATVDYAAFLDELLGV